MLAHLGHSDDPDTLDAIEAVISQIKTDLAGAEPRAALLYASVEYEHQEMLDRVQEEWPGLALVGGTSDGEFSSSLGFCEDSILMTVFSGEDLEVHAGVGRNLSQDLDAATAAATAGSEAMVPDLCLTTFAPSTDASAAIESLAAHLPEASCPVLGGLSADHREFERTREFFGSEVLSDSLPLLLIKGTVSTSWGVGSGWSPIGEDMTVTKSSGAVVSEIDGRSVLAVYRERYGEVPSESLGEYPLAVMEPSGSWALRASLGMDIDEQTLTFAGSVPEGSCVRFTQVLEEGLLSGSEESFQRALTCFQGDSPSIALFFSCAARKWVLGSEAEKEIELLKNVALDRGLTDLILGGLYCFGEIAPRHGGSSNAFHNETCVSIVLGQ